VERWNVNETIDAPVKSCDFRMSFKISFFWAEILPKAPWCDGITNFCLQILMHSLHEDFKTFGYKKWLLVQSTSSIIENHCFETINEYLNTTHANKWRKTFHVTSLVLKIVKGNSFNNNLFLQILTWPHTESTIKQHDLFF